ncbi:MAG: SLATT domain-containing protein [Candidatus Paceibacterota bacterium]
MKDQLDYTLWVTSGIRFSQSLRYEKLESTINFTLLMLSVYLTMFSLLIPHLFEDDAQLVSLFITASSILITALVVLLKSANFNRRSILQHECGRKIRKLLYDLKIVDNEKEIIAINNKYNEILDDFENHKKIDLSYFWYESYDKVEDSKKNNAPNMFHRNFMAPLVYSVFPFVTKTLSILVPPILMYMMAIN